MFPQFNAVFNVQFARFKAYPVQLNFVIRVVRVCFDGFLIVDERGVVILNRFRFLTLVVVRLALRAARDEQSETNTQE